MKGQKMNILLIIIAVFVTLLLMAFSYELGSKTSKLDTYKKLDKMLENELRRNNDILNLTYHFKKN